MYNKKKISNIEFQNFINTLDKEWIEKEALIVPTIRDTIPIILENDRLFENSDILINRHWRFEPEFTHAHEFFEMIYVYNGQCINTIDTKKQILSTGDFCIISPNVKHSLWAEENDIIFNICMRKHTFNATFFDIVSQNELLDIFYKNALYGKSTVNYLLFHTEKDKTLKSLCEKMYHEFNSNEKYFEKIILGMIIYFFSHILRNYEKNSEVSFSNNESNKKAGEIMYYLQKNYVYASLEETASYFGYSSTHFSKLIKKLTGKTFIELITKQRMEQSISLLKKSDISIAKVAELVGYNNVEHFYRMFKKYYNTSPSQFRNSK